MGNYILTNNKSDYSPEQNVHGSQKGQVQARNTAEQIDFLKSHVKLPEFSRKKMSIYEVISGPVSTVFHCSGNLSIILISYSNLRLTYIEFSGGNSLILNKFGFRIFIKNESFLLKNFEMLLSGNMSEGDFKEDLVRDNPKNYGEIWSVLTSGENFHARYSYNSRNTSIKPEDYLTKFYLFKHSSRLSRVGRNPFSGELFAHVSGQVRPEISFEGANWSLDRVSFYETNPTATIKFSIFKLCFVLHLDGKTYDLPNYVEVLRGTITQIEFKNRLRRDIQHDFDRVWAFLVEREKGHLAYYTRKW
jgi:hypothetical protein